LVNVPVTEDWFIPEAPPVNPVPEGTDQLYVVLAGTMVTGGLLAGVMVKLLPLHTTGDWSGIVGLGLMVTVMVNALPTQLPATPEVGVTE